MATEKPDLAVNTPTGVSILLGTGKYLTPYSVGTSIVQAGAGCLVTGDLNGDGKPDLLVPVNGTVLAYLGSGNGTFTLQSMTPTPSGGVLALGDFNHDGKLDLATSGNLIALGNGDGTFQNPTDIVANPPSGGFSGIAAGDINNDGWPDLVFTSDVFPVDASATVLVNNHQGGFTQVPTSFGGLSVQPILTDLNGDGKLDLVLLATAGGGAWVYLGNGAGQFTFQVTLAGPIINTAGLIMASDVNGDGIPDIGVLAGDTLEIYLGEGGATYATPFSIGTGPSPGSILFENLHGQSPKAGLPDIVETDTSGGVMVLFNLTP
jgi:FG-GAP-like repeat